MRFDERSLEGYGFYGDPEKIPILLLPQLISSVVASSIELFP